MTIKQITLAMMAITLAACGKANDSVQPGTGPNGAEGNTPTVNCNGAWNQYVTSHPQGRMEEFKSVTRMLTEGSELNRTVTNESTRVLESQTDRVTIETSVSGRRTTSTLTQAQFMDSCQKGASPDVPADTTVEVLERKSLSVTVPAGTFNSTYTKVRSQSRRGTAIIETWVDSLGTNVKTKTTVDTKSNGNSIQIITERELVRRQN
jgi:hypothetical protein